MKKVDDNGDVQQHNNTLQLYNFCHLINRLINENDEQSDVGGDDYFGGLNDAGFSSNEDNEDNEDNGEVDEDNEDNGEVDEVGEIEVDEDDEDDEDEETSSNLNSSMDNNERRSLLDALEKVIVMLYLHYLIENQG